MKKDYQKAIRELGVTQCLNLLWENGVIGEGAHTLSVYYNITRKQADNAINAARLLPQVKGH